MSFVHLHVHSCFSLLDGASTPGDLCQRAGELGMPALALTDHHGLYGAVRFAKAAKTHGIRPIFGTELTLEDQTHIVLLAREEEGWRNLCRIITRAHLRSPLHQPRASLETLAEFREGLFVLTGCEKGPLYQALREGGAESAKSVARKLQAIFGSDALFVELVSPMERFEEARDNHRLADVAESLGLRTVATNDVHHVDRAGFPVSDVLTCIRLIQRVTAPHAERKANAERYLKSEAEMRELFREFPEAIENTRYIAANCDFALDVTGWRLPKFETPTGVSALSLLRRLTTEGLRERLGRRAGPNYARRLREELALIEEMGFADYFLICHDIVHAARSRGIRTTGRGSAGNSLVAFALGIVAPDPLAHGMIFQRFMNRERRGLPDVDIDFCSRRRDEVLAYVYDRYGEDNVAAVATLNTFQARSAVRETAKAMGYLPEEIDDLARVFPFLSSRDIEGSFRDCPEVRHCRVDPAAVRRVLEIADCITDFPRHLGIHVGGIVISDRVLTDYVPLQQSTKGIVICQYDKDDVEELGLVKLDLLGLRIHSAIERCLDLVEREQGTRPEIDHVPLDDPTTYQLMQEARTVGCFQLESPGERSLQVRLLPANFTDVIANISLFRPGPVQADMITPFIERRHGRETVKILHPRLEPILSETYGVITYQEQVLLVAHAIAGFSLAEADSLRRAMTQGMSQEEFGEIRQRFLEGAIANGVSREDAESIFHQIAGFASYGFCKGHAACFGLIAYQTAYLKAHHSAAFLAGVLSNEPMGFYPARTIVEDAKRLGIAVLRPDVNASEVQYSIEDGAIRIGLLQVVGLAERDQEAIVRERKHNGPYASFVEFCHRLRVDRDGLENLVLCGAFDTIPLSVGDPEPEWVELPSGTTEAHPRTYVRQDALEHRRGLLWNLPMVVGAARAGSWLQSDSGLQPAAHSGLKPTVWLAALERELLLLDYETLHLSPLRHPIALVRDRLMREGCSRSLDLLQMKSGKRVKVAGVVVSRNRPPVKSGRTVVFITLEDEVGLLDAVVFEEAYHKWRNVLFGSDTLIVEGKLERPGGTTVSVIVNRAQPLNPLGAATPTGLALTPGPGDHSHVKLQHQHAHAATGRPEVTAARG